MHKQNLRGFAQRRCRRTIRARYAPVPWLCCRCTAPALGTPPAFHTKNPFSFMELQDVQELTNFFERRVRPISPLFLEK